MGTVQLTVFARSDVGRVRKHNEDAFAVSDLDSGTRLEAPATNVDVRDRGVLMVVSDGMGGHAAGEVASELVVNSLRSSLSDPAADHSSLQRLIDNAVRRANVDVWKAAHAEQRRGMGATVTAVLVHDTDAFVATVGDSRAYLLREGKIRQITKDQSFVQALIDAGVLTPEQARNAPNKNVILQAMGLKESVQVSIGRLRLFRGDRFLLCSDGLSNKVPDEELQGLLALEDLSTACDRMIDLANERGGDDNLTAIVARVDGDGLPAFKAGVRSSPTVEILQAYDAEKKEKPDRDDDEDEPGPRKAAPTSTSASAASAPPSPASASPASASASPASVSPASASPAPASPASVPVAAASAASPAGSRRWLGLALVGLALIVAVLLVWWKR